MSITRPRMGAGLRATAGDTAYEQELNKCKE